MTTSFIILLAWHATAVHDVPPAKILNLASWKLTLPTDADKPGRPDEVRQPRLTTFVDAKHFFVNDAGNAVVFRAPCGGATTKNSKYPRCELREMNADGTSPASWSTTDGEHTMTLQLAITKTPPVRKHVVCAQIHDADDDVLMIRLEGKKLLIERNETGDVELDADYQLGSLVDLKIQAANSRVRVWHAGMIKLDWKLSRSACYFKAGCYTQSNRTRGDAPDAHGEVAIHRLQIEHR